MDVNVLSEDYWTPLHIACEQGHVSVVATIVAHGKADLNMLAGVHGTPLHCAVVRDRVPVVSYLLLQHVDTQ